MCNGKNLSVCVDDSGRWGNGGLFSALTSRSPQPQTQYELAGKMKGNHYILTAQTLSVFLYPCNMNSHAL